MRSISIAAAALASMTCAGAAQAQMVSAQNPGTVVSALQSAGYQAELTKDDSGDPLVKSASSGTKFSIFFYGCTNNKECRTVQFYSGWSDPKNASLSTLNTWNAKNRFGRAYQSDTGGARLEMDVDLDDGGLSRALFVDNLEFWVLTMGNFEKLIYNR